MNEKLEKMMQEFNSREGVDKLRSAVRMLANFNDLDVVYQKLAEHIDYERRRRGLILEDKMETSSKSFDYNNRVGFAYAAYFKGLEPKAAPIVFIADHYEKMALAAQRERDAANDLLRSVLKKRKVSTIRKAIKSRLK